MGFVIGLRSSGFIADFPVIPTANNTAHSTVSLSFNDLTLHDVPRLAADAKHSCPKILFHDDAAKKQMSNILGKPFQDSNQHLPNVPDSSFCLCNN